MNRTNSLLLLVVTFCLLTGSVASAAAPTLREQLVYSLTSFNGASFSNSFCPQNEDTLYFIADTKNVINPRKTVVYYWPITRKYMAGFSTLNQKMPGELQILEGGQVIQTLEQRKYTLYYPEGYWSEKAVIYLDEEAESYYQKYQEAVAEFNQKLREYYEAMERYRVEFNQFLEEVRIRRERGETGPLDISIPKEPEPPEFVQFYATEPQEGFIINLPVGEYQIQLLAEDGTIFEGSKKNVVVFTSRREEGVGYEIIPGNRWTQRENCNDPSWIIHALGKNELYVNLFEQKEYNELYHNKLLNPQNTGRIERWKWVHVNPIDEVEILLSKDQQVLQRVDKAPYYVKQIPGPELGYEIVEYTEELRRQGYQPTFESYKITLAEDLPPTDYTLSAIQKGTEQPLPQSERTIRLLNKENSSYLYAVSLLPLIIGVVVILSRSQKVEK